MAVIDGQGVTLFLCLVEIWRQAKLCPHCSHEYYSLELSSHYQKLDTKRVGRLHDDLVTRTLCFYWTQNVILDIYSYKNWIYSILLHTQGKYCGRISSHAERSCSFIFSLCRQKPNQCRRFLTKKIPNNCDGFRWCMHLLIVV